MEVVGRILAGLPALLAVLAALRVLAGLRGQRALGALGLVLIALQAPLSLIGYLAALQIDVGRTTMALLAGGGFLAGLAAAGLVQVVRAGRRRAVRRVGWLPVPTALAVAGVQTTAVLGDLGPLRTALGALTATSGLAVGTAAGALVLLALRHPASASAALMLPAPDPFAVIARDSPPGTSPPPRRIPPADAAASAAAPPAPVAPVAPRRRRVLLATVGGVAALTTLAAALVLAERGDHGDDPTGTPGGTGSASATPTTAGPDRTGSVAWRLAADGADLLPPTVVGDTVLVGDLDGQLRGADQQTGTVRWSLSVGESVPATPAVIGGDAYVVSGIDLVAVDPEDGTVRWRLQTVAMNAFATPPVASGALVVTATDRAVFAIDPTDGSVRWRTDARDGSLFSSAPTATDDLVLIADESQLRAYDTTDGALAWAFTLAEGEGSWSAPAITRDRAYLATGQRLVALDLGTGREVWSMAAPDGDQFNESPVSSDDRVYVTDGHLYALRADDGAEAWVSDGVNPASSPAVASTPVLAGDLVLVPAGDGLYAVDRANGEVRWRFRVDETMGVGVPVISGSEVYVESVSMGGSVGHGVDLRTGQELWSVDIPGESYFSAPVPSGGIVVFPGREALIAVR